VQKQRDETSAGVRPRADFGESRFVARRAAPKTATAGPVGRRPGPSNSGTPSSRLRYRLNAPTTRYALIGFDNTPLG